MLTRLLIIGSDLTPLIAPIIGQWAIGTLGHAEDRRARAWIGIDLGPLGQHTAQAFEPRVWQLIFCQREMGAGSLGSGACGNKSLDNTILKRMKTNHRQTSTRFQQLQP